MSLKQSDVERLRDIKDEIKSLLDEATNIIRGAQSKQIYNQARAYWLAHILINLDNDHEWVNQELSTMQHTIDRIEKEVAEQKMTCATCAHFRKRQPKDNQVEKLHANSTGWCTANDMGTEPGLLRCGGDDYEQGRHEQ